MAADNEEALVAWLVSQSRSGAESSVIGDDAALLDLESGAFAITVDAQHEGVHLPFGVDPTVAARRLLAVNLSDLAAVGASPKLGVLSLAAPAGYDRRAFLSSLLSAADEVGLQIVGGDSSRLDVLSATLTLVGVRQPAGRWLRRGDARPGDRLWLGGSLGEAALGLRLLDAGARYDGRSVSLPPELDLSPEQTRTAERVVRAQCEPVPQLELGRALATSGLRVAAIDVSDGLGKDLARLCAQSDTGARVEHLPVAPDFAALARVLSIEPSELALGGGEDYALLFTLPPGAEPPSPAPVRFGEVVREAGVRLATTDGERAIDGLGFDHLAE